MHGLSDQDGHLQNFAKSRGKFAIVTCRILDLRSNYCFINDGLIFIKLFILKYSNYL